MSLVCTETMFKCVLCMQEEVGGLSIHFPISFPVTSEPADLPEILVSQEKNTGVVITKFKWASIEGGGDSSVGKRERTSVRGDLGCVLLTKED